jgi:hypothetical protein
VFGQLRLGDFTQTVHAGKRCARIVGDETGRRSVVLEFDHHVRDAGDIEQR